MISPQGRFPFPNAKLIWDGADRRMEINATCMFRAAFSVRSGKIRNAWLSITAETRYRLWINGCWVLDGPARGYPDRRFFDELDVTGHLRNGDNEIEVSVTSYGVDTFQSRRAAPFLLAGFSYECDGARHEIVTDASWYVRRAVECAEPMPRVSCQLGFEEYWDGRHAAARWRPATMVDSVEEGCFTCLPRETNLLSRNQRLITKVLRRDVVTSLDGGWTLAIRRALSPDPEGVNLLGMAGVFGVCLEVEKACELHLYLLGPLAGLFCDGKEVAVSVDQDLLSGSVVLLPGRHWITLAVCSGNDHATELSFGYAASEKVAWHGMDDFAPSIWVRSQSLWSTEFLSNCYFNASGPLPLPVEYRFASGCEETLRRVLALAASESFEDLCRKAAVRSVERELVSTNDAYLFLRTDRVANPVPQKNQIDFPVVVNAKSTRLLLDLGELTIGYIDLTFHAHEGDVVDVFCFEYLEAGDEAANQVIQYLCQSDFSYRNSFRYVAHEGLNQFASRQRRGFRYVQIVFRGAPITLHSVSVHEATYETRQVSVYSSSDEKLNGIFSISRRTALLCMEDTFTDCPSYEQTLWIGDARNQALVACTGFGAYDLCKHSILLAAHSINELPLVASQCPSGWDVIIPSFSFLWGISVWDVYMQSGDREFLKAVYPALRKNLDNASAFIGDNKLFKACAWNFFDWAPIDQGQEVVIHNSLLLIGALRAGSKVARLLGESNDAMRFDDVLRTLSEGVLRTWDERSRSFSDAVLLDGSLSPKRSQHTSFLALLFADLTPLVHQAALANCLHPPDGMTRIGSPNALFFLIDALIECGFRKEALDLIRQNWGSMIDAGSSTCWEMINQTGSRFFTRSHCHGWSSTPVYLLPKIFFGIRLIEAGWRRVEIAPCLYDLDYVSTEVCTPFGPLKLNLARNGREGVSIRIQRPPEVEIIVLPSGEKYTVSVN